MFKQLASATGLLAAVSAMVLNQGASQEHKEIDEKEAGETVVQLSDTPAVVQAVLKKHAGSVAIDEIEMETEDGVTVYEASWKVGDIEHEVSVDSNGQVHETEHVVTGEAIPKAVREAAAKHMPKGAEAEFELKSIVLYSVEATVNGEEVELLLDPAGRLMELEEDDDHVQGDDDHEDDDDEGEDEEDEDDDDDHEDDAA